MNENVEKYLDELSKKVMNKSTIEQPSVDFTQHLMSQIESLNSSTVTTYVPLISKRAWMLIALVLVSVVAFILFGSIETSERWDSLIQRDFLSGFSISNPFSGIEFSKTLFYAIVLLASMICVQIPILKHYFNKRLSV